MQRIALLLLSASLYLAVPWNMPAGARRVVLPPPEIGQRFIYTVSFSALHVGSAEMTVVGRDSIGDHQVWRAVLHITGGFSFFGVNDSTTSWFDPTTFASRRFVQRLREGRRTSDHDFRIDPERRVYSNNGARELPSVALPLDDVSFLYFVRSLQLEPGNVITFNRYFRPEGNPVTLRIIKRDTIQVPAGQFAALLVEPEIRTTGIFARGGHAQVWLSDDSTRTVLQLKSQLSIGSINLYLNRIISPSRTITPPP